ncbi:hypothetical protein [Ralstonia sp.]|uniref:hypothetical protein n=1 Tax=Ralstonia sp. TaxID=54061 RepID=UPI0031DA1E69
MFEAAVFRSFLGGLGGDNLMRFSPGAVIALGTGIFGLAKYSITIRVKSSSDMMAPYSCTNRR